MQLSIKLSNQEINYENAFDYFKEAYEYAKRTRSSDWFNRLVTENLNLYSKVLPPFYIGNLNRIHNLMWTDEETKAKMLDDWERAILDNLEIVYS